MKLTNLCTNLELSRKLNELGLVKESCFYWWSYEDVAGRKVTKLAYTDDDYSGAKNSKCYPAPTASELGEVLPFKVFKRHDDFYYLKINKYSGAKPVKNNTWEIAYEFGSGDNTKLLNNKALFGAKTLVDVMAKILIYLAENNLLKENHD